MIQASDAQLLPRRISGDINQIEWRSLTIGNHARGGRTLGRVARGWEGEEKQQQIKKKAALVRLLSQDRLD